MTTRAYELLDKISKISKGKKIQSLVDDLRREVRRLEDSRTCDQCDGLGKTDCMECGGSGEVDCDCCGGEGRV